MLESHSFLLDVKKENIFCFFIVLMEIYKVGEFVAIARLHGNDWYVGALTNWDAREVELDLSFLGDGNYKLELFKDGINADRAACDYKKEVIPVPADRKVKVKMAPGGGWAAKIYK